MGSTRAAEGPRRLAFIDDRFHQVYGAQRNVLLLAQMSAAAGDDAIVYVTSEGALAGESRRLGLTTVAVEAPVELRRFERQALVGSPRQALRTSRLMLRYGRRLAAVLAQDEREIVVAGSFRSALLAAVWRRTARRRRVLLYAQNDIPYGVPAALAGAISDRIGLIGPSCAATFPAWSQPLLRRRYRDLASGRDLRRFRRSTVPASERDRLEIVSAGAVSPRKGYDRLIRAIAAAGLRERARLTIVGSADDDLGRAHRADLETLAQREGVEVELVGWQDDIRPFLDRADVFALASTHEGLPGVLLEAMAAGLACVTTAAGNAGDLVRACGAGIVCPVGDDVALAASLRTLADDPDAVDEFGVTGARRVAERYGTDHFLERFDAILCELDRRSLFTRR